MTREEQGEDVREGEGGDQEGAEEEVSGVEEGEREVVVCMLLVRTR